MYLKIANEVIENEIKGIREAKSLLDNRFNQLINYIANSSGRVVMCGMGKSGHIAKKIFATFVSTGTPSMYMHPAEAFHGDLGMIKSEDIFFAISNSGETDEVIKLLPFIKSNKNTLIAMTGNANSTLAKMSDFHVNISVEKEACPLNLAPTTSTTVSLVLGDAIAIALMKANDFKEENFAVYHPGGNLGRKLLSMVIDESREPVYVSLNCSLIDIMKIMSENLTGLVVVGDKGACEGIVTDGDIRKCLANYEHGDMRDIKAEQLMRVSPYRIDGNTRCVIADKKMEEFGINSFLVEIKGQIVGVYDNLNRKR
jgi:arabinose-5-phosphate isomerase